MNFYFIVDDYHGPSFIKKLFQKKLDEHIFTGKLLNVKRVPPGSSKIQRIIKAVSKKGIRIIILTDAEGLQPFEKKHKILQNIDSAYHKQIRIVLLCYEIEEWICYSNGFKINSKPSEILKTKLQYKKSNLPDYALKLDCDKLRDCKSFEHLLNAINS